MADEYIKRGALLAAYDKEHEGEPGRARKLIEDIPAADVQPVRQGRWIFGTTMHHDWMKCSECLVSQDVNGCFSYCPNCGAHMMDGEA